MGNPINKSGKKLENYRESFLVRNNIPFKSGGTTTIDFEILTEPKIWLECTNQNGPGSAYEKLPNKVMKYIRKREITDTIYVERGVKVPNKDIMNNLKEIEEWKKVKIKVLSSKEVDDLLLNTKFVEPLERFL